ncbi:MAG: YedE-related selenium metabolism membrane protein [Clostridia bacterium]|nr:YedE-related selenium metabolism membrane protein [Clostridia bacterium]MBR4018661.1 YedE-related selenium metabolism membrane protein [Clostridia bacterium]
MKKFLPVLLTGIVIGVCALALTAAGNPANMGFCIACFLRDIAGAIKLHSAAVVQYVRPEIIGIIVGAMAAALIKKEWKAVGGSSPVTRFLLAVVVMIGALVFLGCPLRMVIRIGGGDFNAIVGLVGFIAGIFVGTIALKNGFTLKRTYAQTCVEGSFLPIMFIVLMVLVALMPALFVFSTEGPGSMTAPVVLALAAGVIVGVLAQRSRFCMAGGIRDSIMFNQWNLTLGLVAVIVTVLVGNLILGKFKPGFADQAVAHTDGLMNFLGMGIVGWGSVLLGGCPLRQLILTGEGNSDSAITVTGFVFGAAIAHNFGTASSGAGAGANGPAAVVACYIVLLLVTIFNVKAAKNN